MKRAHLFACLSALAAFASANPARADTDTSMKIYGFGEADYIYDSKRVDPNWQSAFRPSKIATPEGEFGSNGQSDVSVKQSRFGVSGSHPTDTDFGDVSFKFEFDLFGVGVDEGQTTFRLRHAYGEWGPLLVGQTNSVFMDIDVFPNVIDYWGPAGMVFYRNVQFRYTPWRTEHSNFAIAVERPGNDIDPGTLRQLDPDLGNNIESDEKMPDLTTHFYTSDDWGHAQLAAILRRVGYDTLNTPDNRPKGAQVGWGVNASGHVNLFDKDKLIGQVVHGNGIASYMNDGGVDLAAEGVPGALFPRAVPLTGVVAYYDRTWNDYFTSSAGYSFTLVDNASFQDATAFHRGQYASINLLWTPTKDILIGGELLWGKRTNFDGVTGDDIRFQFSVKYSWGHEFEF